MTCSCARLKVGGRLTDHRDWNPDCDEHGTASEWYRSPEQTAKRAADSERLRDLQRQAREARAATRTPENVEPPSERCLGVENGQDCGGVVCRWNHVPSTPENVEEPDDAHGS